MLKVENLHVSYGAIHALKGVSLHVKEGEIVTLVGPNGAGKTTLLRTLSGLLKPSSGEIVYQGQKIVGLSPDRIVRLGLAQVPEGRLIFQNLTVADNLELGAYARHDVRQKKQDLAFIFDLFPRLKERLHQNAGTLSGGEQQMLAIGRALMSKPRLLLLDEPSLGIAPVLVAQIFKVLTYINQQGTTLLLVEQDAFLALKTAKRAYVLETGHVKVSGLCDELKEHPDVKRAYLGG